MDLMQSIENGNYWKDVMYEVVNQEGFEPWDVDVCALADAYIEKIRDIKLVNFDVPGTVVLVGSVLVKLKSDMVSSDTFMFEEALSMAEEEPIEEDQIADFDDDDDLDMDETLPPSISEPGLAVRRIPKRKITLPELMIFLRKVIKQTESKNVKKLERRERRIELEVRSKNLEMIMKRVYREIRIKTRKDPTTFKELVGGWDRDNIIDYFFPLLHLANKSKITLEQQDLFGDILIKAVKP